MEYICKQLNLISLDIVPTDTDGLTPEEKKVADKALPGAPGFVTV